MYYYSVSNAISYAFKFFGKHFLPIFIISMFVVVLANALQMPVDFFVINTLGTLSMERTKDIVTLKEYFSPLFGTLLYISTFTLISAFFFFCLSRALLPLCLGEELKLKNLLPPFNQIIKFLAGFIMITVPLLIGALLFFIFTSAPVTNFFYENGLLSLLFALPIMMLASGIIVFAMLLRYAFFYLSLIEGLSFSDSLRKSAEITIGKRNRIIILILLMLVFNFIGKALILGIIITVPIFALAMIYTYLKIDGNRIDNYKVQKTEENLLD